MKSIIGTRNVITRQLVVGLLVVAAILLGLVGAPYLKLVGSEPGTSAADHETDTSRTGAGQRLLRIDEQWYPSGAAVVDAAGQKAKRLEQLNEEAYPSTADVRAHNPSRLARVNNELYPDDVATAATRPSNQQRLWRIDLSLNPPEAIPAVRSGRPQ